jgi:hypothetical protein
MTRRLLEVWSDSARQLQCGPRVGEILFSATSPSLNALNAADALEVADGWSAATVAKNRAIRAAQKTVWIGPKGLTIGTKPSSLILGDVKLGWMRTVKTYDTSRKFRKMYGTPRPPYASADPTRDAGIANGLGNTYFSYAYTALAGDATGLAKTYAALKTVFGTALPPQDQCAYVVSTGQGGSGWGTVLTRTSVLAMAPAGKTILAIPIASATFAEGNAGNKLIGISFDTTAAPGFAGVRAITYGITGQYLNDVQQIPLANIGASMITMEADPETQTIFNLLSPMVFTNVATNEQGPSTGFVAAFTATGNPAAFPIPYGMYTPTGGDIISVAGAYCKAGLLAFKCYAYGSVPWFNTFTVRGLVTTDTTTNITTVAETGFGGDWDGSLLQYSGNAAMSAGDITKVSAMKFRTWSHIAPVQIPASPLKTTDFYADATKAGEDVENTVMIDASDGQPAILFEDADKRASGKALAMSHYAIDATEPTVADIGAVWMSFSANLYTASAYTTAGVLAAPQPSIDEMASAILGGAVVLNKGVADLDIACREVFGATAAGLTTKTGAAMTGDEFDQRAMFDNDLPCCDLLTEKQRAAHGMLQCVVNQSPLHSFVVKALLGARQVRKYIRKDYVTTNAGSGI